jgi:TPR repeat protein
VYDILFENGDGIPIDKSLAAHYFKLAADQGHPAAQYMYDLSLANGEDIRLTNHLQLIISNALATKASWMHGSIMRHLDEGGISECVSNENNQIRFLLWG